MDKPRVAKLLLQIFGARADIYALASYDGNNVSYRIVREPFTEDLVLRHLDGEIGIGAYQLALDSSVNWIGWDIDGESIAEAQAQTLLLLHQLNNLPYMVEFSGSKGYHIILALTEPMKAEEGKLIVDAVRNQAGLAKSGSSHCEAYPKQSALSVSQPNGNLLKLPLGVHPRSHARSIFIDPGNGWESGSQLDPLEILSHRVTPEQVRSLVAVRSPEQSLADLIIPSWVAGDRHSLALAVAGFLCSSGWGQSATEDLIRSICNRSGDEDVHNRLEAVENTFRAAKEGKPVMGYSGLANLLPGGILRQLIDISSSVVTEPGVHTMDDIRLSRGADHLKIRQAVELIWQSAGEHGKWLKGEGGDLYYLEINSHALYPIPRASEEVEPFFTFLNREFGLNISDRFSRQTYTSLRLKVDGQGEIVKICRRNYWSREEKKLFVSLGGAEVYILDGEDIKVGWNGECGAIFITKPKAKVLDLSTPPRRGIAWRMLLEDLSLTSSQQAPATPEQQMELLKAWILATFFPELAITKVLLMFLGEPGSGKTTAARRIVKILDGTDQDVIGITTDKEDSLRASLTNHHVVVLDNLEKSGARWLPDILNRVATGSGIELRKLYTTNTAELIHPECFVGVTAVSLPFSDETVLDRALPIEFKRRSEFKGESALQTDLLEHYSEIWLDLLLQLNAIVKILRSLDLKSLTLKERMADFDAFCQVISRVWPEPGKVMLAGLKLLSRQQSGALADNSPFISALEIWINSYPEDCIQPHSLSEVTNILRSVARSSGDSRWKWTHAKGLKSHMEGLRQILVEDFGMKESFEGNEHRGRVLYTFGNKEEEPNA